eukprot:TRINITY_DN48257_c0_g1_i1.p1 TRINITY_DN48257_c0_g1~~TRINITY_DN48257_c0_g1_i1.p1  ORF type:complete len:176 (+),score=23.28 TRINITY_DN48257_c0_g1_i1:1-528(+)
MVEKQPSLKIPIEHGVPVTVIPGELELGVPGVFAVLSDVGNASNSVFTLQTTLQTCVRTHAPAKASPNPDDPDCAVIGKETSINLNKHDAVHIDGLCKFVEHWSGGPSGHILQDLEDYKKTLTQRRKLRHEDLGKLAMVSLGDCPNIIPVTWSKLRCYKVSYFKATFTHYIEASL